MTVTSVTSLAVDPPTLIVSVNRDASSFPLIKRLGAFGVNILTADRLDIAKRFAGKGGLKGADRFAGLIGLRAFQAFRCWSVRWRRSTARSRRSSNVIRTASSSAASATSGARCATPRSPIGTANTSRSTTRRMPQDLPRSACPHEVGALSEGK